MSQSDVQNSIPVLETPGFKIKTLQSLHFFIVSVLIFSECTWGSYTGTSSQSYTHSIFYCKIVSTHLFSTCTMVHVQDKFLPFKSDSPKTRM